MDADTLKRLTDYVSELVREGDALAATSWVQKRAANVHYSGPPPRYVDLSAFCKWQGRLRHLAHLLGDHAAPWRDALTAEVANHENNFVRLHGTVKAIQETLAAGLLVRVQDLVMAEAFDSLLEQGEYLFNESYTLAAGTLGRAVLEEHLRALCVNAGAMPTTARPTMNDLCQSLYKGNHLSKIELKHVEAMTAVGNAAAHNQPFKSEDIERLLRDVREFLLKHPR